MTQINSLVELAQAIEAGEEFETKNVQGSWVNYTKYDDPTEVSLVDSFVCGIPLRIKPKTKVIDMTPFIENGLDCIFSGGDTPGFISTLTSITESKLTGVYYKDGCGTAWARCQPRLNHPFIWENQELPEGLVMEYGYGVCSSGEIKWVKEYEVINARGLTFRPVVARIIDKKDGYVWAGGE